MRVLKIFSVIIFFFLLCIISYLNLGKFLDVTENPTKTDLLVCLGGGDYKIRVQKTVEIYKKGLDTSNIIILTGFVNSPRDVKQGIVEDRRLTFLKKYAPNATVILNKTLENTAQEVTYVKRYMLKHHLSNVTFVTEPPHSRRILMLFSMVSLAGDEHLSARVVGADYKNWHRDRYYEDEFARNYALSEVAKIIYALLEYKVLKPLGVLPWFEKTFSKDINATKKHLQVYLNFIS
jgi:uncharacterized SAM-binding protein YcdF (DUF218 family)